MANLFDMKFCPKCKGLLMPAKEGLLCASCGYKESASAEVKEEIKRKPRAAAVPEQEGDTDLKETMPTVDAVCSKCGHDKALWYTQQTRASDEPETQFFICKKCSHKWRKY
jgi:DNA-directed RNA polymerase subunit M